MDEPQKHFDKPKKQGTKIISYLYIDILGPLHKIYLW